MSVMVRPSLGRFVRSSAAVVGCLTAVGVLAASRSRPDLFKIDLRPTTAAPSATGVALLSPARSPFGIALTRDGHVIFDVSFTATGLPAPSTLGRFDSYVLWAARDDLGEMQKLGVLRSGQSLTGRVSYNKFLIVVTAERGAAGAADKWTGPIVLRGFAPSALLENFSGKTMFNGGMPQ